MINFYFNEYESLDLDVYVKDKINFPIIQEEIIQEPIEGSPLGSLTIKTGDYLDCEIEMKLTIFSNDNVKGKFRIIKKWLKNIKDNRLSFDYERCYEVKNVLLNPYTLNKRTIEIDVKFICRPFLKAFYTSYETISNNRVIYSEGFDKSYPQVKLTLPSTKQALQISFNDILFQLKDVSDYVFIDSERQVILDKNNQSLSMKKIGRYPFLQEGENTISWIGNITKFEINKNERFDSDDEYF